jgi:major membrane immunogen (membrane-anchored lipoprotein)
LKQTILLTLILLLFISCNKELNIQPKYSDFKTDLEAKNLFGKVKEFSQFRENIKSSDKNRTEKSTINLKETFTKNGSLKKSEFFDSYGKTQQTTENIYNEKGNLLKSITLNNNYPQKMVEKLIHSDSINRMESRMITINDTLNYKFTLKFDEFNNVKQQLKIENKDTLIVNFKYEYDSKKRLIKSEQLEKNNKSINQFEYDENGNVVELIFTSDFFKFKTVTTYMKNRLSKIENYNISKELKQELESITEFDNYYNPINKKTYQNSELNRESKNEYEFDNNGNWIKKTVYLKEHFANSEKFIPIYIENRKIKYWE